MANLFSPHSTFRSLLWRSILTLDSMIDLSEEEKDWNISTTAKVCHTLRQLNWDSLLSVSSTGGTYEPMA